MKRLRFRHLPPLPKGLRTCPMNGFSLIEIMITIAIIGAIAALVWPTYSALTRKSDQLRCASNLRQIGTAIHAYTQDQSGWLPGLSGAAQRAHYRGSTLASPSALVDFLHPYLALPDNTSREWTTAPVFVCPASRKIVNPHDNSLNDNIYFNHLSTYIEAGLIQRPFGYLNKAVPTPPMKMETIQFITKTMALGDRSLEESYGLQAHGSTLNILFMDGHVDAVLATHFVKRKDSTYEIIP